MKNKHKLWLLIVVILVLIVGTYAYLQPSSTPAFTLISNDSNSVNQGGSSNAGHSGRSDDGGNQISPSISFPVSKAPDLAAAISGGNTGNVQFQGFTLDKNQCLYILAKAIIMIDNGEIGNIPIKKFKDASNPHGDLDSATITKDEYVDMAGRTYNWMDSNGRAPNNMGIASSGDPDLSTDMTLKLFANVLTEYKRTGQLISPVEVP